MLVICDLAFAKSGDSLYPSLAPTLIHPAGVKDDYMEGALGEVILVNGAPWPVANVANTRYRLRILNASNARRYDLQLRVATAIRVPRSCRSAAMPACSQRHNSSIRSGSHRPNTSM